MTTPPVPSITDEQLADIEKTAEIANLSGGGWRNFSNLYDLIEFIAAAKPKDILSLIARLRAAEAVCDDLRPDAERYRWLRDEANNTREDAPQVLITDWSGSPVSIQPWAYPQGEKLDAAIDTAMERHP